MIRTGLVVAALVLAGCGARTELSSGTTSSDAGVDRFEASTDASVDVIVTDAGCASDDACDDRVACTLDRCDPSLHVCTHAPRPALCDDGVFCNGSKACDAVQGCVPSAPPSCEEGIACTVDTCNEAKKGCDHVPHDELCPISHACDPALGCQARALAHSGTTLYDVRLPSGQVKAIGSTVAQLTDVALSPQNVLYGIGFSSLYTVNTQTGVATLFKNTSAGAMNGADMAPNGELYVAGGSALYALSIATGVPTFVASFPGAQQSSGDLAFVGARLLASATGAGPTGDDLIEFNLATKTSTVIGPIGFTCVWGLAAYGPTLYGLTCTGQVLSIDPNSGKGTLLNKASIGFWGATAR